MWKNSWPGFKPHSALPQQGATATSARRIGNEAGAKVAPATVDTASNRNGLKANSNAQRQRIFAQFFSSSATKNTSHDAQKALLIGQTIDPKVAEKYMSAVEFDHIGRIVAFKKDLSGKALDALQGALIKSLTQTNTRDDRIDARPGGDCLIQFMHLMQNARGETAQELLSQSRMLWMSGNLSDDAVGEFLVNAARQLQDTLALQSVAMVLANAVNKPKEATQRNDNMYGRRFESEFVHTLVKNPPAGTLEATRRIGQALLADFDKVHASKVVSIEASLKKLAESIELRPWSTETPDLERFMHEPTRANLEAMLLKVDHGMDILKIQSLVSKVSATFSEDIEWITLANRMYKNVVQPARNTRPFQHSEQDLGANSPHTGAEKDEKAGLNIETNGYGTGLASHPDYEKRSAFRSAKDKSHGRMNPDMGKLSAMEQQSLHHGHAIVSGTSGNANLLTYLSQRIAKQDSDFSIEQAALAGMMFLVFDGGHSLNEVMAVYTGIRSGENVKLSPEETQQFDRLEKRFLMGKAPPDTAKRMAQSYMQRALEEKQEEMFAQHVESYHLDYRAIVDLAKHKGHDHEIRAAMDTALDKTIDYFNDNSYYTRQNMSAGGMT